MAIYQLDDRVPLIHESAFVADSATVIGDVRLAPHSSVWFGATLRGDTEPIVVGNGSNIQDGAVLHAEAGQPLEIAESVTVGHQAVLHGCTIGKGSLIGIQAVVLDGAVIGRQCLVGAGTIVTAGKVFPDRTLILGTPAKVVRALSDNELAKLEANIRFYAEQRRTRYRDKLTRIDRN
ncbi:gamma carbonic anhydrase family protein [Burkholderia pyrrocinia]|uniref:gamma carbonic anhydrase family protein n=1 Tax=Burkholderia pyrrocinia TaxID=60550 RepID=UPI00104B201E|nr:gamma carbonic anhydrase family protein [Burkholderia pyrrocinia]TDA47814.1 gamma carbonic anhydrase family protein [Burkholderia pyrrocinia]